MASARGRGRGTREHTHGWSVGGGHLPSGPTEPPQPNKRLQATADSLRSCVAPAIGGA